MFRKIPHKSSYANYRSHQRNFASSRNTPVSTWEPRMLS